MARNADRLGAFFDYMGRRNEQDQFVMEKSFFLGNSGYFLLSTEAHSKFLTNGKSSLEKLQKKGWYRVDLNLPTEYLKIFHANSFLLFYDKTGRVLPHKEKEWLKTWNKKVIMNLSRKENLQFNSKLNGIPISILDIAVDKIERWAEEGAQYFGLPDDWNDRPLAPEVEMELIPVKPTLDLVPPLTPPDEFMIRSTSSEQIDMFEFVTV